MSIAARSKLLHLVAFSLLGIACVPAAAVAAAAGDSGATVECKLPGRIMTTGGHARMAAGQIVQTTPADCRQRGGEYTVPPPAPAATAAVTPPPQAADARIIACLLPAQTRQLGEKARYRSNRRVQRMSVADCRTNGGKPYTPRRRPARHKA